MGSSRLFSNNGETRMKNTFKGYGVRIMWVDESSYTNHTYRNTFDFSTMYPTIISTDITDDSFLINTYEKYQNREEVITSWKKRIEGK